MHCPIYYYNLANQFIYFLEIERYDTFFCLFLTNLFIGCIFIFNIARIFYFFFFFLDIKINLSYIKMLLFYVIFISIEI